MNRRFLVAFVGSAVVLVGVALLAVAQAEEEKSTPGPAGLSQQLLERLQKLEARVAQLEQRPAFPVYPTQVNPLPHQTVPPSYVVPPGTSPSVPEGWVPQEFNGIRYYIVPIDKGAQTK